MKGVARLFVPAPQAVAQFDTRIARSIKALSRGEANDDQQIRAMAWIINVLCRTYESPYYPASDRDTAFACGKAFIGQQLAGIVNLNAELLENIK